MTLAPSSWHLSMAVEKAFGDQSQKKADAHADLPMHMRWKNKEELFHENLDAHLAEYTLSAVEASSGYHTLHIATDKASVNGLPLQASLMVIPSGVMVVAVPQVPTKEHRPPIIWGIPTQDEQLLNQGVAYVGVVIKNRLPSRCIL